MKMQRWLLYPLTRTHEGYPWGVSADAPGMGTEIHGPFWSLEEAQAYALGLADEYDDYTNIMVCKIETPHVQTIRKAAA